ncbi:MAG: DUF3566 domain-containing protein [Actinomycetes bacterium]
MTVRNGAPAETVQMAGQAGPRVRVARLRMSRLDPWSVMKVAFLLSIAVFVVLLVAVTLVWLVLDSMGVFESVGRTVEDVTGAGETDAFDLVAFLGFGRVLGFTTMVGLLNVVLVTALATLCAFLYNIAASLAGGIEVTLTETENSVWGRPNP